MRLAVNIEHVADLVASADSYHPTPQAIEFVRRLAFAALEGGGAHALQGPYGAGKSSLAAFALNELSQATATFKPRARLQLFEVHDEAVSRVHERGGLVPIPIVGASEPLALRLGMAIKAFARGVPARQRSAALKSCVSLKPEEARSGQVLDLLIGLARAMRGRGRAGTLLVVDEFGRHLEHMLASESESDFHLLQNIAEATGRPDAPMSLVIIQHFGLEHYGAKFYGTKRAEWEKVRGRFRETVLSNSETDAAHIAGKALASLGVAGDGQWRFEGNGQEIPRVLKDAEFLAAAQKCQPLHPMTVALLSRLARLLGQQDRTIVGWLTSDMDTGFKAFRAKAGKGWMYPEVLFHHFFGDSLLVPSNPALAKRFAAIQAAHRRIPDSLGENARALFRTLAMLSFCGGRGLNADRNGALACHESRFPFDECIAQLTSLSLVVYRRYRNEYVVWEGSDYDVAGRVDDLVATMSLDLAAEMNRRLARSVLAHGHLVRTGNRRGAQVNWHNANEPPTPSRDVERAPRVLVWIGEGTAQAMVDDEVVGTVQIHALEPHIRESAAIRRLLDEDSELQDDIVARKELQTRLNFHEARILLLAQNVLDSDQQWRVGGREYSRMQPAISAAMDAAYPRAFELHNELVNRDRVSGQITLALRKLFERLHEASEEENLGIEKFPAERVIYESVLKRTGLHRPTSTGAWALDLESGELPCGLRRCIEEIRGLSVGGGQPPTVEAIVRHMAARPFGMKRTPAILVCVLILLWDRDRHELYEDRQFLPDWGPQTLLRLLKAPSRFAIATAMKEPMSKRFMREYGKALTGYDSSDRMVVIVRRLLQRHARLSIYARRTEALSTAAKRFRRGLETAKSPADMLLRAIPDAFAYGSLPTRGQEERDFLAGVRRVWVELDAVDAGLLARLEQVAVDALGAGNMEDARAVCRELARRVLAESQMHHGFDQFLKRVVDESVADDGSWFARVVDEGLGIPTPMKSWSDGHASQAEFLLRRNLLAMQQAGRLLTDLQIQEDARPFAVFWPNPADGKTGSDLEALCQRLSALIKELPKSERVSAIVSLAREYRGAG